jgi:hypothetical protein
MSMKLPWHRTVGSRYGAASLAERIKERQWPRSRPDRPGGIEQLLELLKGCLEGALSVFLTWCADLYIGAC